MRTSAIDGVESSLAANVRIFLRGVLPGRKLVEVDVLGGDYPRRLPHVDVVHGEVLARVTYADGGRVAFYSIGEASAIPGGSA